MSDLAKCELGHEAKEYQSAEHGKTEHGVSCWSQWGIHHRVTVVADIPEAAEAQARAGWNAWHAAKPAQQRPMDLKATVLSEIRTETLCWSNGAQAGMDEACSFLRLHAGERVVIENAMDRESYHEYLAQTAGGVVGLRAAWLTDIREEPREMTEDDWKALPEGEIVEVPGTMGWVKRYWRVYDATESTPYCVWRFKLADGHYCGTTATDRCRLPGGT